MFTSDDYFYGWLLYIVGGAVFMGCWWYLSAQIRLPELRQVLRLLMAVIIFVPWYASPDLDYLAPAVVIALLEGLFDGAEAFWRAGTPLVVALIAALTLSLLFYLGRWFWRRRTPAT